jgi:hypothetical protein
VAEVVADVVGEGADGEGELVGGFGVVQEGEDEVAGTDVVGELGEEGVAEGVVAEVLYGAAAVGVGVSFEELSFGEGGVVLEEDGADGRLPGDVDELLVGLDGVRDGRGRREKECQGGDRFKEGGAAWGWNVSVPSCAVALQLSLYIARGSDEKVRLTEGVCDAVDGLEVGSVCGCCGGVRGGGLGLALWDAAVRRDYTCGFAEGDAGAGDGAARWGNLAAGGASRAGSAGELLG